MDNVLKEKSYAFALRIVRLYKYLNCHHHEFVISKQVLRCGTAVGALVRESEFGQSKADFINKLSIALKEANETDYWLSILKDSEFITQKMHESIKPDVTELIKLLVSSVKTAKKNKEKKLINEMEKHNAYYSLFIIHYSLFIIHYSLKK